MWGFQELGCGGEQCLLSSPYRWHQSCSLSSLSKNKISGRFVKQLHANQQYKINAKCPHTYCPKKTTGYLRNTPSQNSNLSISFSCISLLSNGEGLDYWKKNTEEGTRWGRATWQPALLIPLITSDKSLKRPGVMNRDWSNEMKPNRTQSKFNRWTVLPSRLGNWIQSNSNVLVISIVNVTDVLGRGEVLPSMSYIGMCSLKGYGFQFSRFGHK